VPGDHHGVGLADGVEATRGDHLEAAGGLHRSRAFAAEGERVAVALVGMAEDLGRDREVEGDHLVEREDGDPMHRRSVSGRIPAV
jgi:hypothetical protein